MFQDESTVGWDPIALRAYISPSRKLYMLFLLVAVIVTIAKLVTLWIAAPPFKRVTQITCNACEGHERAFSSGWFALCSGGYWSRPLTCLRVPAACSWPNRATQVSCSLLSGISL